MGKNPERDLLQRLQRVEALHAGATTAGERAAAARARERVVERLKAAHAADEVRHFCREHVESLGVDETPESSQPQELPCERRLREVLILWTLGGWSARRVRAWAGRLVDENVLPDAADHPQAALAEVLLQLASTRAQLGVQDVPAVLAFLDGKDWQAWFDVLGRAAVRGRRAV